MQITDVLQVSLNKVQSENLRRFAKKLPKVAEHVKIYDLPGGGKAFQADVRARNISGSFARYEKQVDARGKTILYTKTTYAPDGGIVHIKFKFPPGPAFYPGG
ncbi:MAG: hypothetical protein DRI57_18115 [Deltaproteobacteria bacterium]|nr:MAG: hypothetical protein DRI57_18115 [Deltaproteobacteria bacterium]